MKLSYTTAKTRGFLCEFFTFQKAKRKSLFYGINCCSNFIEKECKIKKQTF